jgi:hypothetical protein
VYKVAAGHNAKGPRSAKHEIASPWDIGRSAAAAGGLVSDVVDQLRWAQFHMGDGRTPDGRRLLKRATLRSMQRPQAEAGNLADAMGLSWMLEDYDGAQVVKHGGTTYGQQAAFVMVPEHGFAVTVLTNSSRGMEVHGAVVSKALSRYLGLDPQRPEAIPHSGEDLAPFAGRYVDAFKSDAIDLEMRGRRLHAEIVSLEDGDGSGLAPFHLVPIGTDRVVVEGGRLDGFRAEFLRDGRNRVAWIRFGGRLWRKSRAR